MFTGLVEGVGNVRRLTASGKDMILSISPGFDVSECSIGDSVAVNGVCLTVTGIKEGELTMYVSGETMSASTMGLLRQGDRVNLERALRVGDRLGGHMVSGHVDGTGRVLSREKAQRSWIFRIGIESRLARYTIEKGSVAVDGISLTINRCQDTFFEVNIIPETANATTLMEKKVGDLVNIETDLIAKYVEKFFIKGRTSGREEASSGIDLEMLEKYGFGD